jgi:protein TonB
MLSRRALVFVAIVALHVGFVIALNAGLAKQAVETVFGPIETKMIEETIEEEEKPPPPPPKIETTPPPFVPPPDIVIDLPVQQTTTTAITATTQKPVAKPPPPAAATVRVPPKQNPRRPYPITDDDYPPQSKRLGEEGVTRVRLLVLPDGSIGDVQVVQSSGFPRLDETAVRKLKRWKVMPGTENGKPVQMWMDLNVKWQIKEEK